VPRDGHRLTTLPADRLTYGFLQILAQTAAAEAGVSLLVFHQCNSINIQVFFTVNDVRRRIQ
jgi:hypothetical protein